jgi:hypothetical protein
MTDRRTFFSFAGGTAAFSALSPIAAAGEALTAKPLPPNFDGLYGVFLFTRA